MFEGENVLIPKQELTEPDISIKRDTVFCDALKKVIGAIVDGKKLIPGIITAEQVVNYLAEEREQTIDVVRMTNNIDPDVLEDTVVAINTEAIMGAVDGCIEEFFQMNASLVSPEVNEMKTYREFIEGMIRTTYEMGEDMAYGWKENSSRVERSDVSLYMAELIEKTGYDTETAIALKNLFGVLLFQSLNTRKSLDNVFIRSGNSVKSFSPSEEKMVEKIGYQLEKLSESLDMEIMTKRALSKVPYIKDVALSGPKDQERHRDISFLIDPRKYVAMQGTNRKYVPPEFYEHFESSRNDVSMPPSVRGYAAESIPEQVEFAIERNASTGFPVVSYDRDEQRYRISVSALFDLTLRKSADVTLGNERKTCSFSQLEYERLHDENLPAFVDVPEAIINEYLRFHRRYVPSQGSYRK
jgi:hypothetical protein